jgi:UDP-N-acetylmuramoyl-tripeptide--D-alanyl-D-alanine ligase
MKSLSLTDILRQIGGHVLHGSGNPVIKNVKNRSRKQIDDHTLVFHFDRDQIRGKYWAENRSIVIVSDEPDQCTDLGEQIVLIKVDNVEEAYWKFIDYYRNLFQIPVIGVTGTCGKTTTKEMMRQILCEDYNVEATWMSMNSKSVNLRYLLGIDDETEVAVFEMPVCYPGYLRIACKYFQPEIRILLNIGVHHLADCETPEEYMKAKAEIVEGLDPVHGTLILNADDENIRKMVDVSHFQRVIYFGKSDGVHFQAKNIRYAKEGMNFTLEHQGEVYEVYVPGYGEHNVYNALSAIAAVSFAGVDIPTAIKRLAVFEQVEEHLEFKAGVNGCTVIDDTWNSSPLSMATALQVLKDVSQGKTSIALLGYMPQLGEGQYANQEYAKLGKKAVETNVDLLIVAGDEAKEIGRRAVELGMNKNKVHFCETGTEIYEILQPYLNEKAVLLLKITHRVMKRPSFTELRNKLIPENSE